MRKKRHHRSEAATAGTASGPGRVRAFVLVAVVAIAAVLVVRSWRPAPRSRATPSTRETSTPQTAPLPGEPDRGGAETPRAFRPLLGEWRRPDGGYVLSVQKVAEGGAATVQYFNPRPIRVARAQARQEQRAVGLFVEFDDVNYPGSTYTLAYDAVNDRLQGVYYQAVQKARYDVVFVRGR